MKGIENYIPHREPFLFVDKIVEISDTSIKTTKYISTGEWFFKGHYPQFPLMPGVLLCEAILQSGAIFVAHRLQLDLTDGLPVVTRMNNVKFKEMVYPESLVELQVEFIEQLSNAFFFKGTAKVGSKLVLYLEFTSSLVKNQKVNSV